MTDASADVAGCCGLCAFSALETWCFLHTFGADVRCCGGPRGCCHSCCDSSFNEDNFDERMTKEQAKNGANPESVNNQLVPSDAMSLAAGDPKPIDVERK